MFDYMNTVLNGLKAWVTGEVNKLLSKIDAVGVVAAKASNVAAKNKNGIASLNKKLSGIADGVNEAQSTADKAQNTAETAQSTAEAARREAYNAFDKAEAAEDTADAAIAQLNYDNGHFYTRSDAKTPLTLRSISFIGTFMFYDYTLGGYIIANTSWGDKYSIHGVVLEKAVHYISSGWHTNLDDTTFTFHIQQVDNVILQSSTISSTKQFEITVDDTGTLKATEVTG
jgi:hypothetical protein